MKAVRIHRHGGPDVLVPEDVHVGQPGAGRRNICAFLMPM